MKNNLSCEIIEDLLPSYIDGLTSAVTDSAVRDHISHCDRCKFILENMKEPYNEEKIFREKKEIDFLKKTRKRNIRVIASGFIIFILIAVIAISSFPYFVRNDLGASMVLYNLNVDGDTFSITATADHKNCVITDICYEEGDGGILDISFKGREKTNFDGIKTLSESYTSDKVKTVVCQGKILWEDGEYILPIVSASFKYRTPYIGDMSHNSLIAGALKIRDNLGSFTNKLTTAKEPYGWEFIFSYPFMEKQKPEKEKLMKEYGYVLLGLIGNLGEVKFTYEVITSDGDIKEYSFTVTEKEATAFLGEEIKKCSEDINILQSLIEKMYLAKIPYINSDDAESFEAEVNQIVKLRILNTSRSPIKRIAVVCVQTKEGSATGFEESYSGSAKKMAIPLSEHSFSLDLLSENAYDEKRLGEMTLDVQIYDFNENVYSLKKPVNVSAFSGAVYDYTLTGDFENGFELAQTP